MSVAALRRRPISTNLCALQGAIPQLSFADLNNDHKLDLVFTCNGYLTIQFGNGDGTFQTPTFSANAGTPVLLDLNGDGFLDIAYFFNTSVAVLLNQGTLNPGVFASPKLYPAPGFSTGLAAGDFNGDGKQDLIYLNGCQCIALFSVHHPFLSCPAMGMAP